MKKIFLIFFFLFIVGCASMQPDVRMDVQKELPSTNPQNVQILYEAPVRGTYVRLGEVRVENAESWTDVVRVLQNRASNIGGDAVYIAQRNSYLKVTYNPPSYYPFYSPFDPFGYGYMYGRSSWTYRFEYPYGFYTDADTLINSTGVIISYTNNASSSPSQEAPEN